jgi:hypothetical protein
MTLGLIHTCHGDHIAHDDCRAWIAHLQALPDGFPVGVEVREASDAERRQFRRARLQNMLMGMSPAPLYLQRTHAHDCTHLPCHRL